MKRAIVAMVLVLGCDADERKFADGSAAEQLAECVVYEDGNCTDRYGPEFASKVGLGGEQCRIREMDEHFAECLEVEGFDTKDADAIGMAAWIALDNCHEYYPDPPPDVQRSVWRLQVQNACEFGWIVASMVDDGGIDLSDLRAEICSSGDSPAACDDMCDSAIDSANQCEASATEWLADCNDPNRSPVSRDECVENAVEYCSEVFGQVETCTEREVAKCDVDDGNGGREYPECTEDEAEARAASHCDDPLPSWC
jgi:hypothetical protein